MKLSDFKTYYHAAPVRVRASIKRHGLDAEKAPYDRSTSGAHVYVFADQDTALWYARHMASVEPREEFDIWKIDPKGLDVSKDYGLTSSDEGDDTAYVIKGNVPKAQVKLYKTVS